MTLLVFQCELQLFAAARKRACASYDIDALAYFVHLRVVATEDATALQALDAPITLTPTLTLTQTLTP